ncbi:Homeobox protein Meis2 [Acetobacter orientalis]|uniref:Homeobox protein Meis2 n=1 Tax=Acetobacter orientalis TaxID=146474 RepID=A0A2Z5ZGK5_9PROT|nr:Homeobox protein Meis2 [Acetobacter orientalis]
MYALAAPYAATPNRPFFSRIWPFLGGGNHSTKAALKL